MQSEFTIAMGADDEQLEIPWQSEDGSLRFFDLRKDPESIFQITEADGNPALVDLLVNLNGDHSVFQTAKCDTWTSDEMDTEDEYFGTTWKHGSYLDVVFCDWRRGDYAANENFAESLNQLLARAPEIPAAAEVVLRRCQFHDVEQAGFALTLYLLGYGDDPEQARQRWAIAARLMQSAIQQLSGVYRGRGE